MEVLDSNLKRIYGNKAGVKRKVSKQMYYDAYKYTVAEALKEHFSTVAEKIGCSEDD